MNQIIQGDNIAIMKTMEDNSVDSVVTDSPYGFSFMSNEWDTFSSNYEYVKWVIQWAKECLRVLKPGGHLLSFSGTRTYHALAWGIESAGFEIRDMIEWLYLSGFPKSMDVGKQFDKQAGVQRQTIGMKRSGTARMGRQDYDVFHRSVTEEQKWTEITKPSTPLAKKWDGWGTSLKPAHEPIVMARKPLSGAVSANAEQYGTGAINIDSCRIQRQSDDRFEYGVNGDEPSAVTDGIYGKFAERQEYTPHESGRFPANCVTTDEEEWYSRYFNITPREVSKKAPRSERSNGNFHPTVKPVDLMAWLIRLVTPPGGIVLDPFAGSGSTLVAAKREGFKYIGIEIMDEYVEIAKRRLEDVSSDKQLSIFDMEASQ